MPLHGLPPVRRLRRRGEFQRVFEQGRRVHGRYFTIIVARSDASASRLGVVASRKLGGAVVRNRAKRLIREVFRQNPDATRAPRDLVVIPKPGLFDASLAALVRDYRAALQRGTSKS